MVGSGAIPALFPPAWIDEPRAAAAWYVDGCTRLHTPLRPALDLGVGRLAVVGTTSLQPRAHHAGDGRGADLGDTAVTLLQIGDLALDVFRSRYRGWRALRDPDVEALHRLLGGDSPLQGELLSFVLFDAVFHRRLIDLGAARRRGHWPMATHCLRPRPRREIGHVRRPERLTPLTDRLVCGQTPSQRTRRAAPLHRRRLRRVHR